MKKNSFFALTILLVIVSVISVISTSCCMRDPFETPLSETYRYLGSRDSHWLYVQISPVAGETRLRHYLICRFYGENKWVVRLDGKFTYYKQTNGFYESTNVCTNLLTVALEPKGEPCRMCKVGADEKARFLDVDRLKILLKQVDRVVIDDGKLGFYLTLPNTEPFWYWESVTFQSGGGDLVKEAKTLTLLLKELKIKE